MPDLHRIDGKEVGCLGLGGTPNTRPQIVDRAFRLGIDYFFFYSLGFEGMIEGAASLCRRHREGVFVATGDESREPTEMVNVRDNALASLGTPELDVFYVEYVSPKDSWDAVIGALAEVSEWKARGLVRYVGASAHDRDLAGKIVETGLVDVLMHRYNMAHRKSEDTALSKAQAANVPVVAFTCTRWGSLLKGHPDWTGRRPTASECYQFALSHRSVRIAMTAPETIRKLEENVSGTVGEQMSPDNLQAWSEYGDLVYGEGTDAFETRWP